MTEDRQRDYTLSTVTAFTVIACCVRLIGLGRLSLWTDEIHSIYVTQYSLWELWLNPYLLDHPPLYFYGLSFWMKWVPHTEFWLRLPSAIVGALSIIPVFYFSKRLIHYRFACLTCALLIVSPLHIRYSQEVRDYSLLFFLSAMFLWVSYELANQPRANWRRLYLLTGCLLTATHAVGLIWMVCVLLVLTLHWREQRCSVRGWVMIQVGLLAAILPVLCLLGYQASVKTEMGFWQEAPTAVDFFSNLKYLCYTQLPSLDYLLRRTVGLNIDYISLESVGWWLFVPPIACAVALTYPERKPIVRWGVLPGCLYIAFIVVFSYLWLPIFAVRTIFPALISVVLPLSASVLCVRNRPAGWISTVCYTLILLLSVMSVYRDGTTNFKEDWRALAETLRAETSPNEPILHWNYITGLGLQFYAQRFGLANSIIGIPQDYTEAILTPGIQVTESGYQSRLHRAATTANRLWLVSFRADDCTPVIESLEEYGFSLVREYPYVSLTLRLLETRG